jgi:hypothetical protein
VLKKSEWVALAKHLKLPLELTLEESRETLQGHTLDDFRTDHRECPMLMWPGALRQVDHRFRSEGILQPYGCSTAAFDTPNP